MELSVEYFLRVSLKQGHKIVFICSGERRATSSYSISLLTTTSVGGENLSTQEHTTS